MRLRFTVVAALITLTFFGCPKRVVAPTEVLDLARGRVAAGSGTATDLALSGFASWLIDKDVEAASKRFEEALKADSGDPFALYGQVLLARRAARPERALGAALTLCERASKHPLASIAARVVLESVGLSTSTDKHISDVGPGLLPRLSGDAAHLLRAALAVIASHRGDTQARQRWQHEAGVVTQATLVGPFAAWHVLSLDTALAPEHTGSLDALPAGAYAPLTARSVRFDEGRLSLDAEAGPGDVYLLAVDVTVPTRGLYVVRTTSRLDHTVLLGGVELTRRRTWATPAPLSTARAVRLTQGTHRLMIRFAKGASGGTLGTSIGRLDGQPSGVTFAAATAAASSWGKGVEALESVDGVHPSAEATAAALETTAGEVLAKLIAATDAAARDRDGARRVLKSMPVGLGDGALVAALRAELLLGDETLPQKVARGRATRDLEAVLTSDPHHIAARLITATLALDDGRHLDALELVKRARVSQAPPGAQTLALEARAQMLLGLDALAITTATAIDAALPGHCEALSMRYDVARRRDAMAESDALLSQAATCGGHLHRVAELARARGQLDKAKAAYEALMPLDEGNLGSLQAWAAVSLSLGRSSEVIAGLERLRKVWPRNAGVAKHLADVYDRLGRTEAALAARQTALTLDGADLALRRAVSRALTGKELLAEYAISTEEALKAYQSAPGVEDVTSAYLLDAAAVRVYPDGSQVDRIHIIQKALDQAGVDEVAEVNIPAGASVLKLRTLKADGTVLEPENIAEKDTISLPGVQVGDSVEYEYLQAHPARGPGQPGFTSASFYFQVARQPNNWSTYVVVAPKGTKLEVDAHHIDAPPVVVEGELEVFRHQERRVPAFIPEPVSPPAGTEWLPYVTVGAGQRGNEGLVHAYADAFMLNGQRTVDVDELAAEARADKTGLEAVKAIYSAVMKRLSGRDSGLGVSAAASVGQDRGSRTWLLYSALKSAGFDARLAAVRTFTSDPAAAKFPSEVLLPYLCVRVALPEGAIWLDTLVRFAPFGELPELALGEREAYLLPEPGAPLEQVKTPPRVDRPGKKVTLSLELSAEGVLSGKGEEVYQGFEAAQLSEALESMAPEQRHQALEQSLSRYFGGADLSKVELDSAREVGAPVKVRYEFKAPRFGRLEGSGRMVLGSLTFPSMLGRRYLALGARRTPLLIDSTERAETITTVKLPPGWQLKEPVPDIKLDTAYGSYRRTERQEKDVLSLGETLVLKQARVAPKQYEAFAQFAGEVDLMQSRDLLVQQP